MADVSITAINFHDGMNSTSFHFDRSRGFHLPRGEISVSVDFKITEAEDQYIILTEILTGPILSYNELIQTAYRQLVARLARFGALAETLRADQAPPSA